MTQDVSGFGLVVTIVASNTLPIGATLSQFASDADPLDFASVRIADSAMGLNGDLITWAKAVALPAVLNVIPNSDDDKTLQILADANRVGKNKASASDLITMTIVYPDGSVITLSGGRITDASFGRSVGSDGKQKTKSYAFTFEDKVGN